MLTYKKLISLKIPTETAKSIIEIYNINKHQPQMCWQEINKLCFNPRISFTAFNYCYEAIYANTAEPHPAWIPTEKGIKQTHLYQAMQALKLSNYPELFNWSIHNREAYWDYAIKKLGLNFKKPYQEIVNLENGVTQPKWLPGAKLNIVDSCFQADSNKTAIIYADEAGNKRSICYAALEKYVNRIANAVKQQFQPGDVIAIDMPMTIEAVAIYLGIIKAGCVVAGIADSFAASEIAIRLKITKAKGVFTQDFQMRAGKKIPLYKKVIEATKTKTILAIVICIDENTNLREHAINQAINFDDFISDNDIFTSVTCKPNNTTNILFSSGTTGEPKAIPWDHTTPIKAAADAYFHHDAKPDDIMAWPTNLGWMMGPWLIYASLINQNTMALFGGAPTSELFGKFIESTGVTILGLVPSIVNAWRAKQTMETFNWDKIKCFSSTGECSNAEDYLYLMWLANNKPVIEYCGGTEIGGAYITGSLVQPATPATFTTPTLGLDFVLLDEKGSLTDDGEVALIPPSIGLSNQLLNRNHNEVYYKDMPSPNKLILRRHGDHIEKITEFCYRGQGRIDDTMNLGGIKTSSTEIERIVNHLIAIKETAAIAVPPKKGGPSKLIIYAVLTEKDIINAADLKLAMQSQIKSQLNPLFKIHDVIIIEQLPRTASNKVMRRVLRQNYLETL